MRSQDLRFYVPETPEEEFALARTRVRERSEGIKVTIAVFGGLALAGAAFAIAARLSGKVAQLLLPAVVILVVIPGAALAIVGASSLIWRNRLSHLTGGREPRETLSPFRRKPHDRHRLHSRHSGVLRAGRRVYARLRTTLRRAS